MKRFIFCSEFFIHNKAGQFTVRGNSFLTFASSLRKRRRSVDTYLEYYFLKRDRIQDNILITNINDFKADEIPE